MARSSVGRYTMATKGGQNRDGCLSSLISQKTRHGTNGVFPWEQETCTHPWARLHRIIVCFSNDEKSGTVLALNSMPNVVGTTLMRPNLVYIKLEMMTQDMMHKLCTTTHEDREGPFFFFFLFFPFIVTF